MHGKEVTMTERIAMRINKNGFRQYFEASDMSQREFARAAEVSHTLVQQILNDPRKTHVQVATAARMEKVFGVPKNILFLPEVFTVISNAA
jgi:transcriptional regulator with XRE-family HTH domain